MRDDSVRVLACLPLLAAGLLATAARATPRALDREPVRVQLAAEQTLRAGSHAAIEVIVELPADNDAPLLLTPSVEGGAVEVVRGRLSRPDGKSIERTGARTRLRFEVPVLAHSEGTAILNVDVMTYVCSRTCERVQLRATQVLRVTPGT